MEVTWYGNASIRVTAKGASLLFDPFVPLRGAAYSLSLDDFLPAPNVCLTHGHLDHARDVPTLVERGASEVYATASPLEAAAKLGVSPEHLHAVKPDTQLLFGEASGTEGICVAVKRGRHIQFDTPLVLRTIFSPLVLRHWKNAKMLLAENRVLKENGETVLYEVSGEDKLITVLGSLGLCEDENYATKPDLLILPYQGNSQLLPLALSIVAKLAPRHVLLDHFDDAFPPLSRAIDVAPFVQAMAQEYPEVPVIVPQRGVAYEVR